MYSKVVQLLHLTNDITVVMLGTNRVQAVWCEYWQPTMYHNSMHHYNIIWAIPFDKHTPPMDDR